MKEKIFTLIITLFSIGFSFGQIKINCVIYSDSTLTKTLSKTKLILKTESGEKTYWSDKNGKINILTDLKSKKYSLKIKKRGYTSISIIEITKDLTFDVILKKQKSLHDKDYEGTSKIIM